MIELIKIEPYRDENNNLIIGIPKEQSKCMVTFKYKNCTLELEEGVRLHDCRIQFDCDNGYCFIGKNTLYKGFIRLGLGCQVIIGNQVSVTSNCFISTAEKTTLRIGDDCMIASQNVIRTDDSHPIYDITTRKRINSSRSIEIGNHVWLADKSTVLAGSNIKSGSVIGYGSIVKGVIDENSIAVGIPAKIIKRNVVWERKHLTLTPPFEF